MKKSTIALLALVVSVLVVAGAWVLLDPPQRGRASTSSATPTAGSGTEPTTLAPSERPAAPPVELTTAAAAAPAPDAAPAKEERRATAAEGGGRRIRGSVSVPAGAPTDDSLRVVAFSSELDVRQIYGTGGALGPDGARDSGPAKELGRAAVGSDGVFQLALSTEADAWLIVDGRFLCSARAERAAAGVEVVELPAELGGCLAGRVKLPAGADPAAFEDIEVALGPDSTEISLSSLGSSALFPRRGALDAEGRFELRALPTGHAHELEVDADAFADAKVPGLAFEPGRVAEVEVALARGATLSGRVVDEQGRPVAEAEVTANESGMWGFPGEELVETKSADDGGFVLEHVAAGKCLLYASADGYLNTEGTKLELVDEAQSAGFELVLERGSTVAGRVHWPDGTGAGAAKVEVDFDPEALAGMGAFNATRGAEGEAESDAEGRFEVTGLGKGPFVVHAKVTRGTGEEKESWLAKVSGIKPDTRDVDLELRAPARVTGRVVDHTGAPVTTFQVVATLKSTVIFLPGETKMSSFQHEEGKFVLRDLQEGSYTIEARAESYGPMTPIGLELPRADDAPVELVLAPAASVAGTVVDPEGQTVTGATVTLQTETAQRIDRMRGNLRIPEATSGKDGTFVLEGLAAGTRALVATRAGFAGSAPVAVEVASGERASGVVLALRKGARLTGEVYGTDGKPAAGTQVLAQDMTVQSMDMRRTDATGSFRFESLDPGSFTVTAILEGRDVETDGSDAEVSASFLENMRFTTVNLEEGEEEHVVLGAPPKDPVRVRGRVRHDGEPVKDGLVTFMAEGAKGMESLKMAPLRDGGTFETELSAPGAYVVTVQLTGGEGGFRQDNVEYRETIPEVEEHVLEFDLPLGAIRGSVRGPDEKPLAGARVTLATEGGIESGSILGGHYAEATTGADGSYSFDCLRPGTYGIAAGGALFGGAFGASSSGGRVVRTGLKVDEGKALDGIDFELGAACDIHGKVVDAQGVAVKDAGIFVRDERGTPLDRFSMIMSGADGTFTYTGVSPGTYNVSARGKGLASADSAPLRVREGEKASVELVLHPATKLLVEVVDDEGTPLAARVSVVDSNGREMQGLFAWAELASGLEGGFDSKQSTIGPLPPGSYTVTAMTEGGGKASKPVTLDGQPERRLKLRVR